LNLKALINKRQILNQKLQFVMNIVSQRRLIPSTSMLLAFDASARTGSFTAAAAELNLTQGAVSRQVGALESQLGVDLFKRFNRAIQLTENGRTYAQEIHGALQSIRTASIKVMSAALSGTLNLAILPTIGSRWLIPRLPLFLQENPDLTVNFVTKLSPFDFRNEDVHCAIHFGLPDWPDAQNIFLMCEEAVPVCSPRLLARHPIDSIEQLRELPLLHLASRSNAWSEWFEFNELEAPPQQGMLFEQFSIISQAAMADLGAALLPRFLIQKEIEQGELVVIFDLPVQSERAYYLVIPRERVAYPPVIALKKWLQDMTA
jgi:LysR family glycine cleavage system transcriptional activator